MININIYGIWKYVNPDLPIKPFPPKILTYQTPFEVAIVFSKIPINTLIQKQKTVISKLFS